MERYNLPAEHIVKLLHRKEINRVDIAKEDSFFDNTIFKEVFLNNFASKNNYTISWEQIHKTEIRLKTDLPRVLKNYYHECGDLDINSCFSEILNLKDIEFSHTWLREMLEDDEHSEKEIEKILKETGNFLIFWTENQGVWNAGIKKEDLSLKNPPVYITTNDDLYSWEKITDDIDTFILIQILNNLQDSRFYFLTFENEEVDFIISDKKISKDRLIKNPLEIKNKNLKFPTYSEYDYNGDKVYIFQLNNDKFEKCWIIKPEAKKDRTSRIDEILLKTAYIISCNDRKVMKKLEIILEDFHNYLRKNENFCYTADEINAFSEKEKIELKITAMILLLSENGYLCYLDWKCELEDFKIISDVMKKIGIDESICNLDEINFDEDDDIEIWSKTFNEAFGRKDIFIGNIDTNSDSYSIFPISRKKLEKLKELGNKLNIGINFLSYSEQ